MSDVQIYVVVLESRAVSQSASWSVRLSDFGMVLYFVVYVVYFSTGGHSLTLIAGHSSPRTLWDTPILCCTHSALSHVRALLMRAPPAQSITLTHHRVEGKEHDGCSYRGERERGLLDFEGALLLYTELRTRQSTTI